jgi:RhtB (resistance to homoserine/threonine) family protein
MEYLHEFLIIASIHLLAVMSPGPDFVMIVKNSLVYNKKTGVFSALGLSLGICVHILYCLLGIGLIISKSIVLFSAIKFIGAGYLIFIGYKSLRAKSQIVSESINLPCRQTGRHATQQAGNIELSVLEAIKQGFLTNVFNPKATLFFLAIFTQVLDPKTPLYIEIIYGLEMVFATFAWFAFVASVLSVSKIKSKFQKIQSKVEKVAGVAMILFGIKLALSKAK